MTQGPRWVRCLPLIDSGPVPRPSERLHGCHGCCGDLRRSSISRHTVDDGLARGGDPF